MGKAAQDLTLLNFRRSGAAFCLLDDFREIFFFANLTADVLTARISGCTGGVEAVFIAVLRRHDAVGRHKDRSVEALKLFFLFPPCISIVADEVRILLESRIVVGRKHLGMGVYIYTGSLCLDQQHLKVAQIVAGNQNARALADTNVYTGHFRMTVSAGIGCIQQSHTLHTVFSGLQG